jgi:hypothetical protein
MFTLYTGIPIAYPRMVFLENALSSKFSPFVVLGRLGNKEFMNRFNGDAELLDDLVLNFILFSSAFQANCFLKKNDRWASAHHKVLVLSFHKNFLLNWALLGRAQSVHRTTSTICPEPKSSYFLLMR